VINATKAGSPAQTAASNSDFAGDIGERGLIKGRQNVLHICVTAADRSYRRKAAQSASMDSNIQWPKIGIYTK